MWWKYKHELHWQFTASCCEEPMIIRLIQSRLRVPKGWEDLIQNVKSVSITAWLNSEHLQSISLKRECEHRSLQRNTSRLPCLFASRPSPIFLMERVVLVLFFIPLFFPDCLSVYLEAPNDLHQPVILLFQSSTGYLLIIFNSWVWIETLIVDAITVQASWSAQLLYFRVTRVIWSGWFIMVCVWPVFQQWTVIWVCLVSSFSVDPMVSVRCTSWRVI